MAAPVYIPTNSVGRFPLLHILSGIYCLETFDDGHSDWPPVSFTTAVSSPMAQGEAGPLSEGDAGSSGTLLLGRGFGIAPLQRAQFTGGWRRSSIWLAACGSKKERGPFSSSQRYEGVFIFRGVISGTPEVLCPSALGYLEIPPSLPRQPNWC